MLGKKVYKDLTRWELYVNMPVYETQETENTIWCSRRKSDTVSCLSQLPKN